MTGVTRLAPSPTGALHLGNARTFLATWLLARQNGWRVALRIDDLDGPRVKAGSAGGAVEDLQWLGLDWDSGPTFQTNRHIEHAAALQLLISSGAAYPCVCTRSEIERAASAPHVEDGATVYPGTCRGRFASVADAVARTNRQPALRFAVPTDGRGVVIFVDDFAGPQRFHVARQLGDFVVAKPDGTPSYQLATVVDDAAAGVTHVVRGDDLLDSTPRQLLLYDVFGLQASAPRYTHLPLVVGSDGRRLAKRHGDSRLSAYRSAGVTADVALAWLARSLGIAGPVTSARDLIGRFDVRDISPHAVTFSGKL